MNIKDFTSKIQVWEEWQKSYKRFVPKFIDEAINKATWESWDNTVFTEFFMRSNNQCVSSLKQGYFTNEEKEKIKSNWHTLAPLLKEIALNQDKPLWDVYTEIQKRIRRFTDVNRKAATYRLIAGLQPNLLCTVVNEKALKQIHHLLSKTIDEKLPEYKNNWFIDSHNICKLFSDHLPQTEVGDLITYPWQTKDYFDEGYDVEDNDMSEVITSSLSEIATLLKYKKQVILQGPPGTGKTKLAKEIAAEIVFSETSSRKLTKETIISYMTAGLKFPSAKDKIEYEVDKVTNSGVSIIAPSKKPYVPLFNEIIKSYDDKVWEKEGAITRGNDSYSAAISKYIYLNQNDQKSEIEESDQIKLIQFHPSYSYEDFVRGIVAEANGVGIEYKNVNKTLGLFADEANKNYLNSKKDNASLKNDIIRKTKLEKFIEHVQEELDNNEGKKYDLTDNVYIFESDEKRFKYKGDNWIAHDKGLNMKYSELELIINANVKERSDIKNLKEVEELTKHHATYFFNTIAKYYEFTEKKHIEINEDLIDNEVNLKNYVLIIDEINRANLSSVLGELIYALEYRGEKVQSMYKVDGKDEIVLPPNLYIIGTMNTADRSIGYIDYAIRRRFAFVDIHPEDLSLEPGIKFDQKRFLEVASLFDHETHLSKEFDSKDVQLGHSYFIDKTDTGGSMEVRLKYEIKPILLEYVKDGILIGEGIVEKIEAL